MKVWICSDGHYSAYCVMGIYTNEAVAKRVTDAYGWGNSPEEIELDPEMPDEVRRGMSLFGVWMWENGDVERISKSDRPSVLDEIYWYMDTSGKGWKISTSCWAMDEAHAIKITNERRIMSLAAGQPPKQPATPEAQP